MTYKEVADMVATIGLPYAYYEFKDNTDREPPFVCFFFPESDDFFADNQNYVFKRTLYIELYTDDKDFEKEALVEGVLASNNLTYRKVEQYIEAERMWQITYEMEVIINE